MIIKYEGAGKPIAQESLDYLTRTICELTRFMGDAADPSLIPIDFRPRFWPLFDIDKKSLDSWVKIPDRENGDVRILGSNDYHCAVEIWTRRKPGDETYDGLVSDIYVVSHPLTIADDNTELIYGQMNKVLLIANVKPMAGRGKQVRYLTQYLGVRESTGTLPSIRDSIERMGQLHELIAPKKQ